jgi:hypothetical protein
MVFVSRATILLSGLAPLQAVTIPPSVAYLQAESGAAVTLHG